MKAPYVHLVAYTDYLSEITGCREVTSLMARCTRAGDCSTAHIYRVNCKDLLAKNV